MVAPRSAAAAFLEDGGVDVDAPLPDTATRLTRQRHVAVPRRSSTKMRPLTSVGIWDSCGEKGGCGEREEAAGEESREVGRRCCWSWMDGGGATGRGWMAAVAWRVCYSGSRGKGAEEGK
jgi:hypothetical protein